MLLIRGAAARQKWSFSAFLSEPALERRTASKPQIAVARAAQFCKHIPVHDVEEL